MSVITFLETAVHEHSKHLRKSKKVRLEPLNEESIKMFKQYIKRLKRLSRRLGAALKFVTQYNLKELDQESLTKLDVLTFFIYEVATTEEMEFWSKLATYKNNLADIEVAIDEEINRVAKIKDLAKNINMHIHSLLQEA